MAGCPYTGPGYTGTLSMPGYTPLSLFPGTRRPLPRALGAVLLRARGPARALSGEKRRRS